MTRSIPDLQALAALEDDAGQLAGRAIEHMQANLTWYERLSADERSWVRLLAQAGIASFLSWCKTTEQRPRITANIFATAPRELTRVISLSETLDIVRSVIDVVERHINEASPATELTSLREAILTYSREVAFAVAHVYASAAESRGAWDARLESLVVDAVLRGDADDEYGSRVAALGWNDVSPVLVIVADAPRDGVTESLERMRAALARLQVLVLVSVQGRHMVLIVGGSAQTDAISERIDAYCGAGAVVIGPSVPHIFAAGRSARAALNGYRAAPARVGLPRPVFAHDLLPERVLLGDTVARHLLVTQVYRALHEAGGALYDTADTYLEHGRSLEATARALFVHANTVRYRLSKISDVTGFDLTQPREAYIVHFALHLGRLTDSRAFPPPKMMALGESPELT